MPNQLSQRDHDRQSQTPQSQTPHDLIKLSDTNMTLSSADEDIRGRSVVDGNGEDVGNVDDLMIDDTEKKVRFIRVSSGGFLGMGAQKFLIPVDAIKQIKGDQVIVSHNREQIASSPAYDPDVVDEKYYDNLYGYYGYRPFWGAGYMYPGYPMYL